MFINNRPAKEGEEEYAIIKLIVKGDQFSTEFTLSHQPDATKGPEGISFVQAAAYTGFESIKHFVDEALKGAQEQLKQ